MKNIILICIMSCCLSKISYAMDNTQYPVLKYDTPSGCSSSENTRESDTENDADIDEDYYSKNPQTHLTQNLEALLDESEQEMHALAIPTRSRSLARFFNSPSPKPLVVPPCSPETTETMRQLVSKINGMNIVLHDLSKHTENTCTHNGAVSTNIQKDIAQLKNELALISEKWGREHLNTDVDHKKMNDTQQELIRHIQSLDDTLQDFVKKLSYTIQTLKDNTENSSSSDEEITHENILNTRYGILIAHALEQEHQLAELKKMLQMQRCTQRCEMLGISSLMALFAVIIYTLNSCVGI